MTRDGRHTATPGKSKVNTDFMFLRCICKTFLFHDNILTFVTTMLLHLSQSQWCGFIIMKMIVHWHDNESTMTVHWHDNESTMTVHWHDNESRMTVHWHDNESTMTVHWHDNESTITVATFLYYSIQTVILSLGIQLPEKYDSQIKTIKFKLKESGVRVSRLAMLVSSL